MAYKTNICCIINIISITYLYYKLLTEKEIEVLKLRQKGLKQSEIAEKLGISQPAVSSFEQSIAKKIEESIQLLDLLKEIGIDLSKYKKNKK